MSDLLSQLWEFFRSTWSSGLEILILSSILYNLYLYVRGTHVARILIGVSLVFLALTFISQILDLWVLGWLLRNFAVFLAVALVVIFQPELRRALNDLGSHHFFTTVLQRREAIEELTDVIFDLSSKGFGALIAIERDISLKSVAESGVALDAGQTVGLGRVTFDVALSAAGILPVTIVPNFTAGVLDPNGNPISLSYQFVNGSINVTSSASVPEPSSLVLTVLGISAAYLRHRWDVRR